MRNLLFSSPKLISCLVPFTNIALTQNALFWTSIQCHWKIVLNFQQCNLSCMKLESLSQCNFIRKICCTSIIICSDVVFVIIRLLRSSRSYNQTQQPPLLVHRTIQELLWELWVHQVSYLLHPVRVRLSSPPCQNHLPLRGYSSFMHTLKVEQSWECLDGAVELHESIPVWNKKLPEHYYAMLVSPIYSVWQRLFVY